MIRPVLVTGFILSRKGRQQRIHGYGYYKVHGCSMGGTGLQAGKVPVTKI